jgi:hypothetical protein
MAKITANNTKEINSLTTNVAVILSEMTSVKNDVREIKDRLEKDYVSQDQFTPVKNIAYGLVSTILLAVIGALVALVLK